MALNGKGRRVVVGRISLPGSGYEADKAAAAAIPIYHGGLQEIIDTRQPCQIAGTDAIAFAGIANCDPFPNMIGPQKEFMIRRCRELGIDISGKVYKTGLVRDGYQGDVDPEAFTDSIGDVQHKLEARGWGTNDDAESLVNVQARQLDDDNPLDHAYAVDEGIVERRVEEMVSDSDQEVTISAREFNDLKDKVRSELSQGVTE